VRGGARLLHPVRGRGRRADLGHHELRDAVEQVLLVPDVVVQRHGLHAELAAQAAHGEGLESFRVHHAQAGPEDPLAREGLSMDPVTPRPAMLDRRPFRRPGSFFGGRHDLGIAPSPVGLTPYNVHLYY
jgi:hypothetical protein